MNMEPLESLFEEDKPARDCALLLASLAWDTISAKKTTEAKMGATDAEDSSRTEPKNKSLWKSLAKNKYSQRLFWCLIKRLGHLMTLKLAAVLAGLAATSHL